MHVGHGRGAVFGDALANLLAFVNFPVTREYYINDAGAQVDVLALSAFLRYREALGEDIGAIPEGLYPGDYLSLVSRTCRAGNMAAACSKSPESEWLGTSARSGDRFATMVMIRADLWRRSTSPTKHFSSERLLNRPRAATSSARRLPTTRAAGGQR